MATEFKLPYTASELSSKLGKIDNISWNDLKDKPFGEGPGQVELLAETTYNGFSLNQTYGAYGYAVSPSGYNLTIGETYTVKWDGVLYTCVAQDMSALLSDAIGLGNLANFGGVGNDEPFVIGWTSYGVSYFSFDTNTSHTVAIYHNTTIIKTLDEKFLPMLSASWNNLTDKPFEDRGKTTIFDGVFELTKVDTDGDGVEDAYESFAFIEDSSNTWLINGKNYDITWNGVTYTSKGVVIDGVGGLGNTDAFMGTGDNGVPFVIIRDTVGIMIEGFIGWLVIVLSPPSNLTISGTYTCKIESLDIKYLDNKYLEFMSVQEEKDILPEQTISLVLEDENTENPDESIFTSGFESGTDGYNALSSVETEKLYHVTWNGETWLCKAQNLKSVLAGEVTVNKAYGLGNTSIMLGTTNGSDTDEPFLIWFYDVVNNNGIRETMAIIATKHSSEDTPYDCTVKIFQPSDCKINSSYLPLEIIDARIEEYINAALGGDY